MKTPGSYLKFFAWGLSALVSAAATVTWGQGFRWQFSGLSTYNIFPLLGLLAFSLMWVMVVVRFFRIRWGIKSAELRGYYRPISFVVIALIILHPGLLVLQLSRDGFGLPPGSYLKYYIAPGAAWAATLGVIAFLIFLVYELRRKYHSRVWWRHIEFVQGFAMGAIYIHGLKLGSHLQHGWFRWIWYFYGIVLATVLFDGYIGRLQKVDSSRPKPV